ncbi:imidazolonepropionase-like amidohydrolase [Hymenobacter luteus]|uniref:Imidazolonepropionase-like amidohydrolase n=2 Tax=Hymenobacter TaxID=89966 RepID=A0A7W9WCP3_9BACT|nr:MULTISPECIES: amidohydrolase family protein [Hymenobacter]MBB4601851.1 imidazolonepropionase-like amidohydrolase [Hymenobacter latericoloratus]MBB6059720.1 imidazolonepropionase-like amidohydrolase [Hymenobacter luteus]
MKLLPRLLAATLPLLAAGCAGRPTQPAYDLVITHANVVDVETGRVLADRTLVISAGLIHQISLPGAQPPAAKRTLDAQGKYLIPGLWDMHVHFRGGDSLAAANRNLLPLYLAHGITTVRDAGGDLTPAIFEWRKQIRAGKLAGPTIYTSGPKIDGPKAFWAGSLEVENQAQIDKALDSLQRLKVDYVKLYESTISREVFLSTITAAEKRGMLTTGHMPYTATLREASARGLDASEHLYYVFKGCSAKEDSITQAVQRSLGTARPLGLFAVLPAIYRTYDAATAARLYQTLAKNKTAVVPTLYIQKLLAELPTTDHSRDTLLAYIDPRIQATYARRLAGARAQSAATRAFNQQLSAKFMTLVPALQQAGVTLLAGSDAGASNSYVYPGTSLLGELELLVQAGLIPAQALQAATINGARFLNADQLSGTIQAGKEADLVLLNRNPLQDIRHLRHINTVVAGGRVYGAAELRQMLQAVKYSR